MSMWWHCYHIYSIYHRTLFAYIQAISDILW